LTAQAPATANDRRPEPETDAVAPWSTIDNAVVGGSSSRCLRHEPVGYAVFEGTVSLLCPTGAVNAQRRLQLAPCSLWVVRP